MSSLVAPSRSPTTSTANDYERLPACIRQYYSAKEYTWLTDAQRARIERAELEPEYDE